MKPNIQRLGDGLSGRMKRTAQESVPTTLELGRINGDMSLTVDGLSNTIPNGSYMVSLWLTHDTYFSYDEVNSIEVEPHYHRAPSVFRSLEPGDRVLVAWVGHEPIVLTIVTSSVTVTTND